MAKESKNNKGKRRANGEGTIYQRKDGRWEGAAYVLTTDGTYKRISKYGNSRDEVYDKLIEAQQKSNKGVPVANKPWSWGSTSTTGLRTWSDPLSGGTPTRSTSKPYGYI